MINHKLLINYFYSQFSMLVFEKMQELQNLADNHASKSFFFHAACPKFYNWACRIVAENLIVKAWKHNIFQFQFSPSFCVIDFSDLHFNLRRRTIPNPKFTKLTKVYLKRADAKSTTSYFLGPTFIGVPK